VFGAPSNLCLELAAAVRMSPDVALSGTPDEWRQAVEAAVTCTGCEHWTLGTLSGFAGPLIALTGLDTCGMNLSGMTTSGKSTAQRLGASAWSTPDIRRPGLFQSARSTDNAVEALARRADGTVLALDELAHVGGKVVAKMIYTIAGGVGKKRMTADAQVRASYTWTTFAILSGESSLEEKVRGDGGEWQAGMAVRIVDIDVTGVNRNVDRATLGTIGQIDQHFGHAGPAFVQAMIEHGLHRQAGDLRDRVFKAARTLAGNDTTDSATIRAALPLAILMIAGELAKTFGVIPPSTSVQGAVRWGWDRFRQSSDAAALDPEALILGSIRGWIAERWDVTIKNVNVVGGINNRETIAWYDADIVYIPKTRLREAAGNGVRESQVASILNRRGMLAKRNEADRFYVRYIPKVGRIESYALRRSEFGRSESASDTETFTVHAGGRDV
jgi:putative DNA primase/helicase